MSEMETPATEPVEPEAEPTPDEANETLEPEAPADEPTE